MPQRNPIINSLHFLIGLYRFFLSPFTGRACRFYPTCSVYADQALEKHGLVAGLWLTFRRITACHPWSRRPGNDPVPDQFEWRLRFRYKRDIPFCNDETRK